MQQAIADIAQGATIIAEILLTQSLLIIPHHHHPHY